MTMRSELGFEWLDCGVGSVNCVRLGLADETSDYVHTSGLSDSFGPCGSLSGLDCN